MSKWKKKALPVILGLSILVPTAAFAANAVTAPEDSVCHQFGRHERFNGEQGQAARDDILALVEKYAPDTLAEWQKVTAEHEQLMSDCKAQAPAQRPELSDEVKAKLQAIREEVKNGTMTRKQAGEELKELGLPDKPDRDGQTGPRNMMAQLDEAVTAGDESAIQDILAQMLEQMQSRTQQLSDKLAEMK